MKNEDSIMSVLAANKRLLQNDEIIKGALKMYELQKTVFVQHQADFNTVQSVEEECEDYVSNEVLNMATALWTCEPGTLENVEVFKHPLMEASPGCKKVDDPSGIPSQINNYSGTSMIFLLQLMQKQHQTILHTE